MTYFSEQVGVSIVTVLEFRIEKAEDMGEAGMMAFANERKGNRSVGAYPRRIHLINSNSKE